MERRSSERAPIKHYGWNTGEGEAIEDLSQKRKHSLRARQIFKPQRLRKDSASKIPAIRFKEKARFKDKIAAAEPTSVYAVDEHASHLGTQFNGRTYNRPETHSPRADCARFMPRFRYLRVPPACAGALSAPRQGGSQVVLAVKFCRTERERERERRLGNAAL